MELVPRGPESCKTRKEQDTGERHSQACAVDRCPAKSGGDQEIDRGIFEEIDAVGEKGDGTDMKRDSKLDAEVSEVKDSNRKDNFAEARHDALTLA